VLVLDGLSSLELDGAQTSASSLCCVDVEADDDVIVVAIFINHKINIILLLYYNFINL